MFYVISLLFLSPKRVPSMDTQNARKRIYVDRFVQGGIVARVMFLWLTFGTITILIAVLLKYFANPTMEFTYYLEDSRQLGGSLLMAFAAVFPLAVLHLMQFTHRFAGPILRLRRMMQNLVLGEEVPKLKFRKNDYWQDLADDFNSIADCLAEARKRIKELETRLDEQMVNI